MKVLAMTTWLMLLNTLHRKYRELVLLWRLQFGREIPLQVLLTLQDLTDLSRSLTALASVVLSNEWEISAEKPAISGRNSDGVNYSMRADRACS